jgi:hypothetical protein
MINIHFLLIASALLAYMLLTLLFLLGLCRAAAKENSMCKMAEPLILIQTSTPLNEIPEQIESATL